MELSEKKSISLGAWVGSFVALQILSPLLKAIFKTIGIQPFFLDLSALSCTHLLMLLALGIIMVRRGVDIAASLKVYAENILRDLGITVVVSTLLLAIGAIMLHYGIQGHVYTGNGALIRRLAGGIGASISGKILMYFSFSLLGPIFEEIFYRRLLYVSLRLRYSRPRALLIAALLFALIHPEAIFFQFIVGAGYCLVYERFKRLNILIFSHIMLNAGIVTYALTH